MEVQSYTVAASLWRIRSLRQREAKRRDKLYISELEAKIRTLEWALREWAFWWENSAQNHNEDVQVVIESLSPCDEPDKGTAIVSSGACQHQPWPAAKAIDYSKWDNQSCYSAEGLESNQHQYGSEQDSEHEAEELEFKLDEEDERDNPCEHTAEELEYGLREGDEDEHDDLRRGAADEADYRVDADDESGGPDLRDRGPEEEFVDNAYACQQMLDTGLTDCGEANKHLLIKRCQRRGDEIHERYAEGLLKFNQEGVCADALIKLDEACRLQIGTFITR